MNYQPIHELIDHFATFEKETGQKDLTAFAHWLQQRLQASESPASPSSTANQLDQDILQSIGELTYHARHYVRKATRDTPLSGWNDLVVMIVLHYQGTQRKSQVIQSSLMDPSSGIEVLKRLLRKGLAEEMPDPDDKRARLVQLSSEGNALFKALSPRLGIIGQIVAGNLSPEEKQALVPILKKLVHFHQPVFVNDYETPLADIVAKYLASATE